MARRKTFLLGQAVIFADGAVAQLEGLEMEPDWAPTHLLVRLTGRWPWQSGRVVRLPVEAATEFRAEDIVLGAASTNGEAVAHAGASHAEGTVNWLDTGSRFHIAPRAVERHAGRFVGLVLKSDGSIHLVGEEGTLMKRRFLVPAESAVYQNHEFVWLDLKGRPLDSLAAYKPDEYVEQDAWNALRGVAGLGETDLRAIRLEVEDGKLMLVGNVASSRLADAAQEAASRVSSVSGIENRLIADTDVEISVASALAQDASTQGERYIVHSRLGKVVLEGQVKPEATQAAVEVARQVAGVVSVESRLQAVGPGKSGAASG